LAKTSAVSLISALPATSVWGACTVSGALSGGSKVNNDCTTISLIGGRSHGFWKDTSTGKALGSAFPYLKTYTKGSDRKKCEKTHLISLIDLVKNETVFLGNDENGQAVSIHINTALTSNASPAKHLAAVYLNAVFGFYSLSLPVMLSSGHTISHGAELIAHLYALDIINPGMDSNDYFGFTDGKTAYTATASGCS
jgi:hypothetical protein